MLSSCTSDDERIYDMLEAVDISAQIPASFFTQMESKKWSDRKEALEPIEKATSVPKILNTDFNELVRILKKTIAKDSNIVVVTSAAKCLCQLARGLRTQFSPHAHSSICVLFEKFKEKRPNVISVMRDAADSVFIATNLEVILEDIISFLDNKNPQIKSEMALFLARTFSRYPSQVLNKKTLRPLINALIKTLSDMDATVRDNSAMAIGTAMKVTGEKLMMTLIADVEPIKVTKIKEFYEKAEIITPSTNGQNGLVVEQVNGKQEAPVVESNGIEEDVEDDEEQIYDMLEAVDISADIPASFYTQMESKKWSDRKEALEPIEKATSVPKIMNTDFNELVRILKKTIAKDSNIVVVTSAAKCLCQLARGLRTQFSPHAHSSICVLFEKFKEKKPNVISVMRDAADAVFMATNLEIILEDIIAFLDNKNPQIKSEMALFLTRAFSKYPTQVLNKKTLRPLINALIKTLSDMDATVRDNSAMAIGTAMKVTGEKLMMTLIADVEPIKIPKIKEFCEKAEVKKVSQSVVNAMNSNSAPQAPIVQQAPPPVKSSATMIRSTSAKRVAPKAPPKPHPTTAPPPVSNATVKRTATIIKRSTVTKRASGIHHPSSAMPAPAAPALIATPETNASNNHTQGSAVPAPKQTFTIPRPPTANSTPAKPIYTSVPNSKPPTRQEGVDLIIFKLISDNNDEVMESIDEIEESLTEESENMYGGRVNQIIDLASLQLTKSVYSHRLNPGGDSQSKKIRRLCDCLMKLFACQQLSTGASQQSLRFLLVQIFTLTQHCGTPVQDEEIILSGLNELSSAIMDSFEPANMMCILTGLLNEPAPASIIEPIKKAIIRSMRSFK